MIDLLKLEADLKELQVLNGNIIKSIYFIGSYNYSKHTSQSDIDILFILKSNLEHEDVVKLGTLFSNYGIVGNPKVFNFKMMECDKCTFVPKDVLKLHMIMIDDVDMEKYVNTKDYLIACWSHNYRLISGHDFFKGKIDKEINQSLLDPFDGIPGFGKILKQTAILKDPVTHADDYYRIHKYIVKMISRLSSEFEDVLGKYSKVIDHVKSLSLTRESFLELSNITKQMEEDVKQHLL